MALKSRLPITITILFGLVATVLLMLQSPLSNAQQQVREVSPVEPVQEVSLEVQPRKTQTSGDELGSEKIQTPASTHELEDLKPSRGEQKAVGPDSAISEKTAEKVLDVRSNPTIEDLIAETEDPIWKVRWDAVNALGELKDPRGLPALVQRALTDESPHPRWRSLWAIRAIDRDGSEAIPLIRPSLENADPIVRRNAAVALAFFAHPESRTVLLEGLGDQDPFRRWEATFSLREVGNIEVAQAMIPLLDPKVEAEKRIRGQAALTIGHIGDKEVIKPLLNALNYDPSPQVRWRAALALSKVGDSSTVDDLVNSAAAENDPQVSASINDAITKLRKR